MIAHQATCVAIGDRAILIEGPPGSGKSALALALIDRGASLVGDDGVLLEAIGSDLFASPHPETSGLIEVRNLGLIRMEPCSRARVTLVIAFDADAPRYIDEAGSAVRCGIALPRVAIWPDTCPPALKVEHALLRYGLKD